MNEDTAKRIVEGQGHEFDPAAEALRKKQIERAITGSSSSMPQRCVTNPIDRWMIEHDPSNDEITEAVIERTQKSMGVSVADIESSDFNSFAAHPAQIVDPQIHTTEIAQSRHTNDTTQQIIDSDAAWDKWKNHD